MLLVLVESASGALRLRSTVGVGKSGMKLGPRPRPGVMMLGGAAALADRSWSRAIRNVGLTDPCLAVGVSSYKSGNVNTPHPYLSQSVYVRFQAQ